MFILKSYSEAALSLVFQFFFWFSWRLALYNCKFSWWQHQSPVDINQPFSPPLLLFVCTLKLPCCDNSEFASLDWLGKEFLQGLYANYVKLLNSLYFQLEQTVYETKGNVFILYHLRFSTCVRHMRVKLCLSWCLYSWVTMTSIFVQNTFVEVNL